MIEMEKVYTPLTYERINELMGIKMVEPVKFTDAEELELQASILNRLQIEKLVIPTTSKELSLLSVIYQKDLLTEGDINKIINVAGRNIKTKIDRELAIYSTIIKIVTLAN